MKGFSVRKQIALLSLCSAFVLALVAVPTANASYIKPELTQFKAVEICRPAPDALTYKIQMKVKWTAIGVSKPSKIRIGYQAIDADSLKVLRSGILNLKKSKGYKGKTSRITASAGESLKYHITGKYVSGGHSVKSKFTLTDQIPTVEQMDANPSAFPNC
jgi:hypothetical protein